MDIAKYFDKALDCQKNEQPEMAITLYLEILAQDPQHLPSLYNLATLYGERGEYAKAQGYYDQLIALEPDFVRAYYNNAYCHLQEKNVTAAQALLEQAVHLVPEYAAAHHLLGSIYFKQENWPFAKKHLLLALDADNEQGEVLNHLGMTCLHLGQIDEAFDYLYRAIQLMPYLAEAQYHLGVIYLKRGEYADAKKYFEGAVDRDPAHFGAWYNLGLLQKQAGFLKLADECFAKAQAIQPDSKILAFLRAAVNPSLSPEHPPEGFVETLFDRYAGYYDAQMHEGLYYQVPEQLHRCFTAEVATGPSSLMIVDLGCGTGLAGELFRPQAKQLRGIDLSAPMLEKAREKKIYDDLQQADIQTAVKQFAPQSIDLFIAADVLGYIGVLDALFADIYQALKPEGHFVFSVESGDQPVALSDRIRFTHSPPYIHELCQHLGFKILHEEKSLLRKEIAGHYFVLQK
jgi:predicted TPR repeat methyltransferase